MNLFKHIAKLQPYLFHYVDILSFLGVFFVGNEIFNVGKTLIKPKLECKKYLRTHIFFVPDKNYFELFITKILGFGAGFISLPI